MPIAPYVEGLVPIPRKTIKNRIDPVPVGFRQGIEIRNTLHQRRGLVTIGSGQLEGVLDITVFGQTAEAEREVAFRDKDKVRAADIITNATLVDDTTLKSVSESVESFNGVIEPLTIRDEVTFSSIEGNIIAHAVKAEFIEGNVNIHGGTDRIEQFVATKNNPEPYADTVETYANLPIPGDRYEIVRNTNKFDETVDKGRGVKISDNMSNDMLIAVQGMSPSTEDIIPTGKLSATAGFIFDSAPGGTDSIAFA